MSRSQWHQIVETDSCISFFYPLKLKPCLFVAALLTLCTQCTHICTHTKPTGLNAHTHTRTHTHTHDDVDCEVFSLCHNPYSNFQVDLFSTSVKSILLTSLSISLHITFAQTCEFHQGTCGLVWLKKRKLLMYYRELKKKKKNFSLWLWYFIPVVMEQGRWLLTFVS